MTALAAVMNRQAVALAADSAVTVGRGEHQKIFNSANKIFTLSKYEPVGVMIYGGAQLNDYPWEVVIKEFRRELGAETEPTVVDYAERFFTWLDKVSFVTAQDQERRAGQEVIAEYKRLVSEADSRALATGASSAEVLPAVIGEAFDEWQQADVLQELPAGYEDQVRADHSPLVTDLRDALFATRGLGSAELEKLLAIGLIALTKWPISEDASVTGVVFAGYGKTEYLPALVHWEVAGLISGHTRRRKGIEARISPQRDALILPFAQWYDAWAFTSGVDPLYQVVIDTTLKTVISEYPAEIIDQIPELNDDQKAAYKSALLPIAQAKVDEYVESLRKERSARFTRPIRETVAALPKDELASMAESLVHLTSLKRRVSSVAETVGGPIDVAVISRGDGFIWINRKHYFDQELNRHFMANYYRKEPV